MRETNVTIIRCDGRGFGCQETVTVDAKDGYPVGWYRIQLCSEHGYGNTQFDFHSLKCVSKWARERDKIKNGNQISTIPIAHNQYEVSILEIIGNSIEKYKVSEVADLMDCAKPTAQRYLDKMTDEGTLVRSGEGNYADPFLYTRKEN